MQLFFGVIGFLLLFVALLVVVALYYLRKGVIRFRKAMTGDLDDEETFRRMTDKHYRGKDTPEFDKDYFKSAGSSSRAKTSSESTDSYRTTTTTAEGVTIIDGRPRENRRKIFDSQEGEYVDYQEVD